MSPAKELAGRLSLSLRQAQRYVARGTIPSGERLLGRDGKRYFIRSGKSMVSRQIGCAISFLKRADRMAGQFGVSEIDASELQRVIDSASEMLSRWRNAA